jgi:hypothetical protein
MQLHSKPAQLGRAVAISMLAAAVFSGWAASASAQNPIEVRFQSPTRGEIVARYADGVLSTAGASDVSSGKWWTGSYSVKLTDLDLESVSYGKFTTEPGSPAAATLSCKGSGDCITKKGKWTQIKCDAEICNKNLKPDGTDSSVDVWCESVAKCQEFVKSLKDSLGKAAQSAS